MSETEIAAAIAEQEEYIKRRRTCNDRPYTNHVFAPDRTWSACIHCGVTETAEDYHRKLAAT